MFKDIFRRLRLNDHGIEKVVMTKVLVQYSEAYVLHVKSWGFG